MKKYITFALVATVIIGCSSSELIINGLICPPTKDRDSARADFNECQIYDLDAAAKASISPLKREQQECMINKGYKISQ